MRLYICLPVRCQLFLPERATTWINQTAHCKYELNLSMYAQSGKCEMSDFSSWKSNNMDRSIAHENYESNLSKYVQSGKGNTRADIMQQGQKPFSKDIYTSLNSTSSNRREEGCSRAFLYGMVGRVYMSVPHQLSQY